MKKNFLFVLGLASFSFFNFNFASSGEPTTYYVIRWTSTCGNKHISKFPTTWSQEDIKLTLMEFNNTDCGNYPTKVNLNMSTNVN